MVTSTREGWFTRKAVGDSTTLTCPRCKCDFPFGPMFDHHPRQCPSCRAKLIELATISVVYLVDPDSAPPIVQELIAYLNQLTEPEAERDFSILLNFLGVEPVF